jgi:hypothetical protein
MLFYYAALLNLAIAAKAEMPKFQEHTCQLSDIIGVFPTSEQGGANRSAGDKNFDSENLSCIS